MFDGHILYVRYLEIPEGYILLHPVITASTWTKISQQKMEPVGSSETT